MKLLNVILTAGALILACSTLSAQAQAAAKPAKGGKEAKIKVYGNCGMCERRIEAAVMELPGVKSASWDDETKFLTVQYDKKKVDVKAMEEKVSAVGHDTDHTRASDEVYSKLPGCCKYDRPAKM